MWRGELGGTNGCDRIKRRGAVKQSGIHGRDRIKKTIAKFHAARRNKSFYYNYFYLSSYIIVIYIIVVIN